MTWYQLTLLRKGPKGHYCMLAAGFVFLGGEQLNLSSAHLPKLVSAEEIGTP